MKRILAAGNEPMNQAEVRIMLEAQGYTIISCPDLQDAVSVVIEEPPDLLIMEKDFAGDKDKDLISVVSACLQKANIPIMLVVTKEDMIKGLDLSLFPVDDLLVKPVDPAQLLTRIRLTEDRVKRVFDNNPLSKLPGNTTILKKIQSIIDDGSGRAVGYIDIDNFKPYNDHYGFSQGDDVILMVARIMVNVIDEIAREGSFVGHIGGDDFVFIANENKIEEISAKILSNFAIVRNMFIEPEDIKRGGYVEKDRQGRLTTYGLLSLSIAIIPTSHGNFKHFCEISAAAAQLKHKVKTMDGNNYLIDRRSAKVE